MRKNSFLKTCFVTAALLATATASQASPAGVRIGTLTCDVAHGWGHVVTSSRQLNCLYHPRHRAPERYTGTLSKYGVDLGYTRSGSMIWEVIAPTSNVGRGALEGRYAGASANATVGLVCTREPMA